MDRRRAHRDRRTSSSSRRRGCPGWRARGESERKREAQLRVRSWRLIDGAVDETASDGGNAVLAAAGADNLDAGELAGGLDRLGGGGRGVVVLAEQAVDAVAVRGQEILHDRLGFHGVPIGGLAS